MLRLFLFFILFMLAWKLLKNYLQKAFGQRYHIKGEPRSQSKADKNNVIDADFREIDEKEKE